MIFVRRLACMHDRSKVRLSLARAASIFIVFICGTPRSEKDAKYPKNVLLFSSRILFEAELIVGDEYRGHRQLEIIIIIITKISISSFFFGSKIAISRFFYKFLFLRLLFYLL